MHTFFFINVAYCVVKTKEIQHPPTLIGMCTLIILSTIAQRASGSGFSLEKCPEKKEGLL